MADQEFLQTLIGNRHRIFSGVLADARENKCRVSFRFLQYRPLEERRAAFDDYYHLDNGWRDPAETSVPDLLSPVSCSLGIFVEMRPLIERGCWPSGVPEMAFGYALGTAQHFAAWGTSSMPGDVRPELKNQFKVEIPHGVGLHESSHCALASVFVRLAGLEEQAWKNLQPRIKKKKRTFQDDDIILNSCRLLENIMRCCVLVSQEPGRFAFHLTEVYENAFVPKLEQFARQRKTGKGLLPEAEYVIQWMHDFQMRESPKPKLERAKKLLREIKAVRWLKTQGDRPPKIKVTIPDRRESERKWSNSVLNDWWRQASKKTRALGLNPTGGNSSSLELEYTVRHGKNHTTQTRRLLSDA